jgi:hypothetical protein
MAKVIQQSSRHALGVPALRRNKRRRAHAHKSYRHFKRPNKANSSGAGLPPQLDSMQLSETPLDTAAPGPSRKMNRRMRRQHGKRSAETRMCEDESGALGGSHLAALDPSAQPQATESRRTSQPGGPEEAADKPDSPRRLPSHLFYAKRFKMEAFCGWNIPQHICGKGHRRKALASAMRTAAVMHDCSHWSPLVATGDVNSLTALLCETITRSPDTGSLRCDAKVVVALCSDEDAFGREFEGWMWSRGCGEKPARLMGPCRVSAQPEVFADIGEEKDSVTVGCNKTCTEERPTEELLFTVTFLVHPAMATGAAEVLKNVARTVVGVHPGVFL